MSTIWLRRGVALEQLAYRDDPAGVDLAIRALGSKSEKMRALAARVLAHYGPIRAQQARQPLLDAYEALSRASGKLGWLARRAFQQVRSPAPEPPGIAAVDDAW